MVQSTEEMGEPTKTEPTVVFGRIKWWCLDLQQHFLASSFAGLYGLLKQKEHNELMHQQELRLSNFADFNVE